MINQIGLGEDSYELFTVRRGKTWKNMERPNRYINVINVLLKMMKFFPPTRTHTHTHTHEKIRDTLRGLLRVVSTGYGKSLVADDTGSTTLFVVGLQS